MVENKCPNCGKYTFPNFEPHICPTTEDTRHCSTCRTATDGAPLCDQCADRLRHEQASTAKAIEDCTCFGEGTIDDLLQNERMLAEYDEWKEANDA